MNEKCIKCGNDKFETDRNQYDIVRVINGNIDVIYTNIVDFDVTMLTCCSCRKKYKFNFEGKLDEI